MNVFFFILTNNIVPIFVLIIIGYLMNRKFNLDIFTLTKLNFYIFVPAFTFVNLYITKIHLEMVKVMIITTLILIINTILSSIVAKKRKYNKGMKNAFANSIMFYNSGNIGIPLMTLVFSSAPFIINGQKPYLSAALTAQIMVLVIQDITTNTLGFVNAGQANTHWRESFIKVLKMPSIYIIPLAFILKLIPYDMTNIPIWPAFEYASKGLVPVALITLGVQLSKTSIKLKNIEVYIASAIRLLVGPIIGFILVKVFAVEGIIAQVIMISTALPTAVNSALIAVECDNYPDFASQVVMTSTLFGAITLVFVIYIARILFPV